MKSKFSLCLLPDLAQTTAYVKPFDYSKQEKPTGCFDSAKKLQATRKLRHADENTDRYSKTSDILFGSESSGSSSSNSISSAAKTKIKRFRHCSFVNLVKIRDYVSSKLEAIQHIKQQCGFQFLPNYKTFKKLYASARKNILGF